MFIKRFLRVAPVVFACCAAAATLLPVSTVAQPRARSAESSAALPVACPSGRSCALFVVPSGKDSFCYTGQCDAAGVCQPVLRSSRKAGIAAASVNPGGNQTEVTSCASAPLECVDGVLQPTANSAKWMPINAGVYCDFAESDNNVCTTPQCSGITCVDNKPVPNEPPKSCGDPEETQCRLTEKMCRDGACQASVTDKPFSTPCTLESGDADVNPCLYPGCSAGNCQLLPRPDDTQCGDALSEECSESTFACVSASCIATVQPINEGKSCSKLSSGEAVQTSACSLAPICEAGKCVQSVRECPASTQKCKRNVCDSASPTGCSEEDVTPCCGNGIVETSLDPTMHEDCDEDSPLCVSCKKAADICPSNEWSTFLNSGSPNILPDLQVQGCTPSASQGDYVKCIDGLDSTCKSIEELQTFADQYLKPAGINYNLQCEAPDLQCSGLQEGKYTTVACLSFNCSSCGNGIVERHLGEECDVNDPQMQGCVGTGCSCVGCKLVCDDTKKCVNSFFCSVNADGSARLTVIWGDELDKKFQEINKAHPLVSSTGCCPQEGFSSTSAPCPEGKDSVVFSAQSLCPLNPGEALGNITCPCSPPPVASPAPINPPPGGGAGPQPQPPPPMPPELVCASGATPVFFEFSRESQKCLFSENCSAGRVNFSEQTCEYCGGSPEYTFWSPGSTQADSCRQSCSNPDPTVPFSGASCCPIDDPAGGVFLTREDCAPTLYTSFSSVGCRIAGFEYGRWICPEELPKYEEWSNAVTANYPVPSGSGTCTGFSMVRGPAFEEISPACQQQVVSRTESSTLIKCSQEWASSCDPVIN